MLFRFSLYGFLKNQRYYDPFLILAFRAKGLSFLQIGMLIGFREICVNLFEIPSGALADLYGRRRSMIFSFSAYIISFVVFALGASPALLFVGMFWFGVGDAFRSGTHKAMIFDWLRLQGRSDERTRVYGYTRSWSQMGSAVSVLIAGGLVFYRGNYTDIFWFSIIPYAFNIINFLGYPSALDGRRESELSLKAVWGFLGKALKQSVQHAPLRRLVVESMGFEGMYKASKDYLQPILKQTAIAVPFFLALEGEKRAALLVAGVYFVLYFLSSIASRNAYKLSGRRRGDEGAARFIWYINASLFVCLTPALWFRLYPAVIALFVGLALLRNVWRPVLISRFNVHSTPEMNATVLSIESQSQSLATVALAPLLGWSVDRVGGFWTVGVAGTLIAVAVILSGLSSKTKKNL